MNKKAFLLSLGVFFASAMERPLPDIFTMLTPKEVHDVLLALQHPPASAIEQPAPDIFTSLKSKDVHNILMTLQYTPEINIVDSEGYTPLHRAIQQNQVLEVINALIAARADVNALDGSGFTPLAWAIPSNNSVLINTLLAEKAMLSDAGIVIARPAQGTVIRRAPRKYRPRSQVVQQPIQQPIDKVDLCDSISSYASLGTIKELIAAGADVNLEAPNGTLPISRAIHRCNAGILKILIENKADVNARESHIRNNNDSTFLHTAISTGKNLTLFNLLLDAKADVTAKNDKGLTPLDLAKSMQESSRTSTKKFPLSAKRQKNLNIMIQTLLDHKDSQGLITVQDNNTQPNQNNEQITGLLEEDSITSEDLEIEKTN
jgi:ankyrin repeat protein